MEDVGVMEMDCRSSASYAIAGGMQHAAEMKS